VIRNLLVVMLLPLAACGGADGTADDTSGGADTRVPEEPFDPACAGQVMFTQTVGTVSTITVDWSGLTADSAGNPIDVTDTLRIVHWYIVGMPPSTVDRRLCDDGDFASDVLDANVSPFGAGATSTTSDIGEGWNHETGIIALYDTTDELSEADPFAAAIFVFDADSTVDRVTLEGRGDVWTAP
jgi:hypothetical protein